MARIKHTIQSLLTKLQTIPDLQYVRIWNNQIKTLEPGKMESFPLPAAFLEIAAPETLVSIGGGATSGDLTVIILIAMQQLDAGDGTMGQNLDIFDLKETIVRALSGFTPTACSALQRSSESQNYDHDNLYLYLVEFKCHMIDSAASRFDPETTTLIDTVPPIGLELIVNDVVAFDDVPVLPGLFWQTEDGQNVINDNGPVEMGNT